MNSSKGKWVQTVLLYPLLILDYSNYFDRGSAVYKYFRGWSFPETLLSMAGIMYSRYGEINQDSRMQDPEENIT